MSTSSFCRTTGRELCNDLRAWSTGKLSRANSIYVAKTIFGAFGACLTSLRCFFHSSSMFNTRRNTYPCWSWGSADKWIKVLMEREKNKSYAIFIASSMFIKTFLSLCERTGSREVCVTQLQLSLSFSSRNYAAFNQTAQKQTVKRIKSEMEIHSPFTMHSL